MKIETYMINSDSTMIKMIQIQTMKEKKEFKCNVLLL